MLLRWLTPSLSITTAGFSSSPFFLISLPFLEVTLASPSTTSATFPAKSFISLLIHEREAFSMCILTWLTASPVPRNLITFTYLIRHSSSWKSKLTWNTDQWSNFAMSWILERLKRSLGFVYLYISSYWNLLTDCFASDHHTSYRSTDPKSSKVGEKTVTRIGDEFVRRHEIRIGRSPKDLYNPSHVADGRALHAGSCYAYRLDLTEQTNSLFERALLAGCRISLFPYTRLPL